MKPTELKQEFIQLRAEGRSYSYIADKLHISKSTCTSWEKELAAEISKLKADELNTLYSSYGMHKEARIKRIGDTLNKVEDALAAADLSEVAPEKLLEFKLKYSEALQKEYAGINSAPNCIDADKIDKENIVAAYGDVLNRARAGDITPEQAREEIFILNNLLKAYEVTELKEKLDALEAIVGGSR